MKITESECMDCATENYPCAGSLCKYAKVTRLFCDHCGEEVEDLYDGLCADCFLAQADVHETTEDY